MSDDPASRGAPGEPVRFASPPAGRIAAGRRRLAALFLGLAAAVLVAAAWAFAQGRVGAGIVALLVALVPLFTWRMSGDLVPRWIEIGPLGLRICTRGRLLTYPLFEATARPLTRAERDHLASLASAGGVALSSGGFDSRVLGEFELFAGDLERAVLVETGDERLIVTPDEPDRFVALVSQRGATPPR